MKEKKKKNQKSIWMSYDLGVRGDYPGLYRWLDSKKAKECGNSVAFFNYEFETNPLDELKEDLEKNVDFKSGDRVYIIIDILLDKEVRTGGKFIIGNRKASPWEGYAPVEENKIDGYEQHFD